MGAALLPPLDGRVRGVLLDLDDTLAVERAAAEAAVRATCGVAGSAHPGLDVGRLAADVFETAGEAWRGVPTITYARRVGISSWEALWASFEGPGPDLAALRLGRERFRTAAWAAALVRHGVDPDRLAGALASRFVAERRARMEVFPDALPLLEGLRSADIPTVVITNGAPDTQRAKLAGTGLDRLVEDVCVSGEEGVGKPDSALFERACRDLGGVGPDVVMVGDSPSRDVEAAVEVGLTAVLLRRSDPGGVPPIRTGPRAYRVGRLTDLLVR